MANKQDIRALRDALTQNPQGKEEEVKVNQRHLIDKILARYSSEFTVFRELLQNSNDAGASSVQIHFQTSGAQRPVHLPTHQSHGKREKVSMVTYRNNGRPFRGTDWHRLKSIAEGNPDEEKIGFFGVGFYSLFSICEEPMVVSGEEMMGFFWKGDQLFTRKRIVDETLRQSISGEFDSQVGPNENADGGYPWTSFLMELREPMDMPNRKSFAQFLVNALVFASDLNAVEVFIDFTRVAQIKRTASPPESTTPSLRFQKIMSPHGFMKLIAVDHRQVQMEARWQVSKAEDREEGLLASAFRSFMGWGSSGNDPDEDIFLEKRGKVFLGITSGHISVKVPEEFIKLMQRSTKKPPPRRIKIQLLHSNFEETSASLTAGAQMKEKNWIFKDIVAYPNSGRVYIGFPTHQTTGFSAQLAASFIPTVERETIDFVDPTLARWNKEILAMAGLLARLVYESELSKLKTIFDATMDHHFEHIVSAVDESHGNKDSEPALASGFWKVLKAVTENNMDVRLDNSNRPQDIERYMKETLSVTGGRRRLSPGPSGAQESLLCKKAIHALKSFHFRPSTPHRMLSDVLRHYFSLPGKHSLGILTTHGVVPMRHARRWSDAGGRELKCFLRLIPTIPDVVMKECGAILDEQFRGEVPPVSVHDVLLEVKAREFTVEEFISLTKWWSVYVPQDHQYERDFLKKHMRTHDYSMVDIRRFVVDKALTQFELPKYVLPYAVSSKLGPQTLEQVYSLTEYTLECLLLHFGEERKPQLESDEDFAKSVLKIVSDFVADESRNEMERAAVVSVFVNIGCVPTVGHGLLKPSGVYLPAVNLLGFEDLPVISKAMMEKVELNEKGLITLGAREALSLQTVFDRLEDLNWDHMQLIKYFVSVRSKLTDAEFERLSENLLLPYEEVDRSGHEKSPVRSPKTSVGSERAKVGQLYAPTDSLLQFKEGIKVLKWTPGRWDQRSEDADFLVQLGLRTWIPLKIWVSLISSVPRDSPRLLQLIQYFVDQYEKRYRRKFNPKTVPAFMRSANARDTKLYRPAEIFGNPGLGLLGLPTVQREWRNYRHLLQIQEMPDPNRIVQHLKSSSFNDSDKAVKIMEFLAGNITLFSRAHVQELREIKFVPIDGGQRWECPRMVYFKSTGEQLGYEEFFDFVDFGRDANLFLYHCGVKREVSPHDLCLALIHHPAALLKKCKLDGYIGILERLAKITPEILRDRALVDSFLHKKVLLGIRNVERDGGVDYTYELESGANIYIKDDERLPVEFMPLTSPYSLENFYLDLGCQRLSHAITKDVEVKGVPSETPLTRKLSSFIQERIPLLVYEGLENEGIGASRRGKNSNLLSHASTTLEKLQVRQVKHIITKFHFRHQVTRESSQCVLYDSTKAKYVLSRTDKSSKTAGNFILIVTWDQMPLVDHFDLGQVLAQILYRQPTFHRALYLSTVLTSTLDSLRRRGLPVERVLKLRRAREKEEERILEELKTKREEEEKKQLLEHEKRKLEDDSAPHNTTRSQIESDAPRVIKQVGKARTDAVSPSHRDPENQAGLQSAKDPRRRSKGGMATMFTKLLQKQNARPGAPSQSELGTGTADSPAHSAGPAPAPLCGRPPGETAVPYEDSRDDLRVMLHKGIKSSRSTRDEEFNSRVQEDPIASSNLPKTTDIANHCHPIPSSNLSLSTTYFGVPVYIESTTTLELQALPAPVFFQEFISFLLNMAQNVFSLAPQTIHVFYQTSDVIAFNRAKSLFFNAYHYHPPRTPADRIRTTGFWFVTFSHELAHNFVSEHNVDHEWYLSSYLREYFHRALVLSTAH